MLAAKSRMSVLLQELKNLREKKVIGTIFLLLIVLAGNFILQGALVLILKTDRPLYTPISGSMRPTLNIGDLLIVQGGLNGESIYAASGTGDIIVFLNPTNPYDLPWVHRAIDKEQVDGKWYIQTKGDANNAADPFRVPEDNVIGKVILSVPVLGYALNFLDETKFYLGGYIITLRIILIIILVAAFFVLELTGSPDDVEDQREESSNEKAEAETAESNH